MFKKRNLKMNQNEFSIIIVEDEISIGLDLKGKLEKIGNKVLGVAVNYDEVVELLKEFSPDLFLLDINLEDSKNGFDVAELVKQQTESKIIFLSAYQDEETFSQALNFNPIAFLNKPFREKEIQYALRIAESKNKIDKKGIPKIDEDEFLFIKQNGALHRLMPKDVVYLKAMDNYTQVYFADQRLVANEYLSGLLEKMPDYFVRTHRSYAINLHKMTSISENTVFLDKLYVPIGKKYKAELIDRLMII